MKVMREAVQRMRSTESGFTLIEMLIVVGIIVALAAAIVPQVVQFGGKGEEGQMAAELSAVQTSMDSLFAAMNTSAVTVQTTGVNTWTALPAYTLTASNPNKGNEKFLTQYLGQDSTTFFYCYTTKGKVTQTTTGGLAC